MPSPLAARVQMTPRTCALYAFGESVSHDLALINSTINGKRPRMPAVLATDDDDRAAPPRAGHGAPADAGVAAAAPPAPSV
jgi:hypothetical protein